MKWQCDNWKNDDDMNWGLSARILMSIFKYLIDFNSTITLTSSTVAILQNTN